MTKESMVPEGGEIKKELPSSVDFMLLGTCNLKCDFCFGPQHEVPAIKKNDAINIIGKLANSGVEKIVFTGGEPTLIRDLPEILSETKDRGLVTVLSTNGLLLSSREGLFDKILPYLDWIALPLDGSTREVNERMRIGEGGSDKMEHFSTVLSLIPKIKKEYPEVKIKLGTVVTKQNLQDIAGIPDLLHTLDALPDTWKLYQISPSEYGRQNYNDLQVNDEDFRKVFNESRKNALRVGITNVAEYTNSERPGKYLFVNPVGIALVVDPITNDYLPIGSMLHDFDRVSSKWKSHVNMKKLADNFDRTYPSTGHEGISTDY